MIHFLLCKILQIYRKNLSFILKSQKFGLVRKPIEK